LVSSDAAVTVGSATLVFASVGAALTMGIDAVAEVELTAVGLPGMPTLKNWPAAPCVSSQPSKSNVAAPVWPLVTRRKKGRS
jgi:hypothetical protein